MTQQKHVVKGQQARRSPLRAASFALPFLLTLSAGSLSACSDDDDGHDHAGNEDAGKSDGGSTADCVKSPTTSTEILNACTDAEKVDKKSKPPLLLPDGGVPPLEGQ